MALNPIIIKIMITLTEGLQLEGKQKIFFPGNFKGFLSWSDQYIKGFILLPFINPSKSGHDIDLRKS